MSQLPQASSPTEQKNGLELSATEIQQQYYESMGDADWELYGKKDRKYLLQKVAIALCGPPTKEGNLILNDDDDADHNNIKLEGYELREEETCMRVFNKICEQAKYSHNGENVLLYLVRILLVTPKDVGFFKKRPKDHWNNLESKKGTDVTICVFHVFCVRRCTMMKSNARSCRIYIDHDGRVYKTWQSYLYENTLPKGIMVVPENGEYKGAISLRDTTNEDSWTLLDTDEMPQVKLTVVPSPALGIGARVLQGADITSTVANVGAVGALVGAAFATPVVVAPVLVTCAVGTGVVTSIYGIVRSSIHLADRGQHEQSIGFKNSEARSSWINIIMSTVGISFSAAAKLVAWAAASGTNIKILMNALQFLKYTNIATGLVGVGNNLGDMIYKWNKYQEKPTGTEIFQFTTSLLFFGIGVMSNATAQEIVQDAQASTINEARDALSSNAKRKAFDKVTAENRRTLGTINGNAETIKALKVISNKDDFFAKLARINKDMNKNKVRVSITSDGKTLINNQHKVSLPELYGMGKGGRNKLFSKLGPADTSTKNAPTRIYASTYGGSSCTFTTKSLKVCVSAEELIKITQFLCKLCQADQEFVAEILSHLSAEIHDIFLLACVDLVSCLVPGDSHFNARVVYFIFDYIKSKVPECDYDNDHAIAIVVKSWIKNGIVDKEVILMLKQRFMDSLTDRASIGDFHNDPLNYDYVHEFRKRHKRFLILQAGEQISIECHTFVVKAATVETLEKWLRVYSQEMSDLLLEFTFKLISKLSTDEVYFLNLINPDEDIIMRVVHYLFHEVTVNNLLKEIMAYETMPDKVVENIKDDLIDWRCSQNVRDHEICKSCSGLIFQ